MRAHHTDENALSSILEQKNTWSRFEFTREMAELVLKNHDVFPSFLHCLQSFGQKSNEDVRIWDGFYYKASISPGRTVQGKNTPQGY
jgi:hypothetical protein